MKMIKTENNGIKNSYCADSQNKSVNPLTSVNFHVTNACNYSCKYCFARFKDIKKKLSYKGAHDIIFELSKKGTKKITVVGGEPLLYPHIEEILKLIKNLGITSSIVTNGSLLTEEFLEKNHRNIDWIGLSIDSGNYTTQRLLGRYDKRSKYNHVDMIRTIVPKIKSYNISIKINTVVTALNYYEDMNGLIEVLSPNRWKVFQVLGIIGENDDHFNTLKITDDQFNVFKQNHLKNNPITESNEEMKGSYVMIDPSGCFSDDTKGYLTTSPPILEVGIKNAFNSINFSLEKFLNRGGLYNWNKQPDYKGGEKND